ncbi:hypothetical protein QTI05_24045 [Variovorax sp. J22R193]|uniref:hypothetical protein n=1 Tax=Variovorax fucosicus TaxID=3053517 RepID=UPI0025765343|nr:hypothetical protein [Variovorax sp. J22R193]MDM0042131.1 hypothetical protein [Variovorax sp. J22R193]
MDLNDLLQRSQQFLQDSYQKRLAELEEQRLTPEAINEIAELKDTIGRASNNKTIK